MPKSCKDGSSFTQTGASTDTGSKHLSDDDPHKKGDVE